MLKTKKTLIFNLLTINFLVPLHPLLANMSESCTASSLGIPQDGNIARVLGCSGAIQTARSPASLAQLARARDL